MKKTTFTLLLTLLFGVGFAQKIGDIKDFKPRFEIFELPGGILGNSVQGIDRPTNPPSPFPRKKQIIRSL